MNPHMPPRPLYDPIASLQAARAVLVAWTDPGPAPAIHHAAARELRAKWPALTRPLDALAHAEGRTTP